MSEKNNNDINDNSNNIIIYFDLFNLHPLVVPHNITGIIIIIKNNIHNIITL